MTKAKVTGLVGLLAGASLAFASLVSAQTASLGVSCSGVATLNAVTWTATATGGHTPYAFAWTGANVSGTTSVVNATYNATGTFTAGVQVTDASSSVATSTCAVTVTALPVVPPPPAPTPAPTPNPVPHLNRPTLQIVGNGEFLARGMTVTSIASGSFQAQVWGITYTINWSGNLQSFLRRDGKDLGENMSVTPTQQVAVGDEVSVSGRIDSASPLVVSAMVVKDASIVTARPPKHEGEDNGRGNDGENSGNGHMMVNGTTTFVLPGTTTTVTISAQARLQELLKQLQSLQDLFNAKRGGGDHGDN